MRYALIFAPFVFSACTSNVNTLVQREKIFHLQKKMQLAQKEKERAEKDVVMLAREIDLAKLELIRRQIDNYEPSPLDPASAFIAEREALYGLIQSGDTEMALEAQVELDRILRIITELSDEEQFVF